VDVVGVRVVGFYVAGCVLKLHAFVVNGHFVTELFLMALRPLSCANGQHARPGGHTRSRAWPVLNRQNYLQPPPAQRRFLQLF
jgi:hypothetical protein